MQTCPYPKSNCDHSDRTQLLYCLTNVVDTASLNEQNFNKQAGSQYDCSSITKFIYLIKRR